MSNSKEAIVTFKAEASLVRALDRIPNRSAFIRSAIQAALENVCPLCRGSGFLTPAQMRHWASFATEHAVQECGTCHERHLVCAHGRAGTTHES